MCEHFVMLQIASILSINDKNDKKKMDFYSKILYSKDLEFTYHSKIKKNKKKNKKNKITKEQKSYVSYEAYNKDLEFTYHSKIIIKKAH